MINPALLVDNLVSLLREIEDLVVEVGGDPERIFAYHDQYPKRASIAAAITDMPAPGIMVAWQGTGPGAMGGFEVWKHHITLYLRARETFDGHAPTAYYRLFRLITMGVPPSSGAAMIYTAVHPNCYPMDLPAMQRTQDVEGLDYFEIPMSFTEVGND